MYRCVNINECAAPELNDCDVSERATCTDTEGSYTCACDSPYVGDGKTCVKVKIRKKPI